VKTAAVAVNIRVFNVLKTELVLVGKMWTAGLY
jgi:hypothetical protein